MSAASIRRSITGTAISTRARSSATLRSAAAGSKRGAMTVVAQRVKPNIRWDRPQAWNSGDGTTWTSRGRNGIRSRMPAAPSSAFAPPPPRVAPFGRPVVPLVRMTTRPWWRTGVVRSPLVAIARSASPSITSAPATSAACSANEPSWTTIDTPSAATTSASCGPAKPVFSRTMSAPVLLAPSRASTNERSLRARTPRVTPGPAPAARRPAATPSERRHICR